jgi:hypothetical protein
MTTQTKITIGNTTAAVVLRVIVEDALVAELVPKPLIFINFYSLFVSFFLNREYCLEKLMTYRVRQRVFLVKKKTI